MEKIAIGTNFFIPMPVLLLGTGVNGKANFMAVGWCCRANGNPPMILCGIANQHYTPECIESAKTFSINLPSSSLLVKTDYCGLVSGKTVDKSQVFDVFYGTLTTAPMIRACPVTLECRLVQMVPLPTHKVFIGEIVGAYADPAIMKDGKPDFTLLDPLLLTMPDNTYWALGEKRGQAWHDGLPLKKKE